MSETATPPGGGGKIADGLPFRALNIAVMTVSDTRDAESDTSGKVLADRVARDGHVLAARALVASHGARILWSGWTVNAIREMIYLSTFFTVYDNQRLFVPSQLLTFQWSP